MLKEDLKSIEDRNFNRLRGLSNEELVSFKDHLMANHRTYSEDFAETIAVIYEDIVDYLFNRKGAFVSTDPEIEISGYRQIMDTVGQAILDCEYVVLGNEDLKSKINPIMNTKEYLLTKTDFDRGIIDAGITYDVSKSGSLYISNPTISMSDGKIILGPVARKIILPAGFDFNNRIDSKADILRETLNLIKSYNNDYSISPNGITYRKGLLERRYVINPENGRFNLELKSQRGIGFEIGISKYDELKSVKNSYDTNYEVFGNENQRNVAGFLEDNKNLGFSIMTSQMFGNNVSRLGGLISEPEEYDKFIDKLDELNDLEIKRVASITDAKEQKYILGEIDSKYEDIAKLTALFTNAITLKEEIGHVIK